MDFTRPSIDYGHGKIHAGQSFLVNAYATNIQTATPKLYRITVPALTYPHLNIHAALSAAGLVELYAGPTLTGQGTPLTNHNRNFNSSRTSSVVIAVDPTQSALGTLKEFLRVTGAGNPGQPVGGQSGDRAEVILAPGDYLVRVAADANGMGSWLSFSWYE